MDPRIVKSLARQLNLDETQAAEALTAAASELRRALAESGSVELPAVGRFFRENGGVAFEPHALLLDAINLDTEGLGAVTAPGRTDLPGPSEDVLEAGAATEEPTSPEPEPVDEVASLEGAPLIPPTTDEAYDAGIPATYEPEVEEPEEEPYAGYEKTEEESYAGYEEREETPFADYAESEEESSDEFEERHDPVTYWNETTYDEAEDLELPALEEDFEEEETDERVRWHDEEESASVLGPYPTPEFEEAEYAEVDEEEPADEGEGPFMPPVAPVPVAPDEPVDDVTETEAASESASLHRAPHRGDRPPERHAQAQPAVEQAPRRRRSIVPILLIGAVLLVGLAVAAYFFLQPSRPPDVAALEETEPLASPSVMPDTAAAGGLADSIAAPTTGAPSETVAEAAQPDAQEPTTPTQQPSAATPPPATASAEPVIDVQAGGWTVVVGSATSAGDAGRIAARYRELGYRAAVLHGPYGGVTRYRVVVNQFSTETAAIEFLRDSPQGFPSDAWRLPISTDFELIP